MKLLEYSVEIPEARELEGGYVPLAHGVQYSIVLRNESDRKCDVDVQIDGRSVGLWRIGACSEIRIERPADDTGRFTFFAVDSSEANQAGLSSGNSLGLICAEFRPEKASSPMVMQSSAEEDPAYGAGGTGLTGESRQRFRRAASIDYDRSKITTVHLRLVAETSEIRPLHSRSTPVPPPIKEISELPPVPQASSESPSRIEPERQVEVRPKGGRGSMVGKAFMFVMTFVLLFLAMGLIGGVATFDPELMVGGIVGYVVLMLLAWASHGGYRVYDRESKRQLKSEYRGAFWVRIGATENSVGLFLFIGVLLAIVARMLSVPVLSIPLLVCALISSLVGLDKVCQRKLDRISRKRR